MKRALLAIMAAWLTVACAFSQTTTILDFESAATSTTFQYFGSSLDGTFTQIVPNPAPGGINSSGSVSNFVKPAGAQTWAGAFSNPNPTTPINATDALLKIKVRMNHIGNLAVKLEQSTSGQPNWIKTVANTQIDTWEELTFDCSLPSEEAPFQAASGTYARVVLFFDFGTPGTSTDVTSHFDDLIVEGGTPPPPSYPVDFSVDMGNYGGNFTTVHVSGNFNGWSGNANPLSDPDGDDVWTGTINLPAGNYEYKFTLDNWAQQEQFTPGAPCTVTNGGFTNRSLTVSGNTTLPEYCWNSCSDCQPSNNAVNFSVDMSQYSGGNFTTVYVSGSFNGWSGDANPLSDPDGDDIWTGTINLAAGNYEYKFTTDNWTTQEQFVPGEPCTVTNSGFTNRSLTVSGTTTLPEYCWNSCSVCGTPNPVVNFSVDMNGYTGGFTTVYLSGNFNGWSGNANAMTDADGDNVWEASISMPAGNYEYKVTLDNWAAQEQFLGTETCTFTTGPFTNRTLTVPSSGLTVPEFCFNSCYACGDEVVMTFQLGKGTAIPHPDGFWLAGGADFGAPGGKYKMTDPDGDGIYQIVVPRQVGYSTYFTFTNGPCPDYSCKENIAGLPCANPNNFNDRFLPAVMSDMTYASCFAQCSDNAQCTYPALSPVFTTTNVLCNGGNNGAITLDVTGGSTIYTYNWGGGITTKNRSNLTAGTYTVTITDAIAQQTLVESVVITQPDALAPAASVTNVLCFGAANGTITLSASGGTPGYTYNWGGGLTGATRTGLAPGVYNATVTDANNCTKTIATTITQPALLTATSTSVNVDCFANATGSINLNPAGGTVAYNFNWNDGNNAQNRTGLVAGTYTVTVSDANNCTAVHTKTITQPTELLVAASTLDVACFGDASGVITLLATGGTVSYSYLWSDGATTANRNNLPIGTYAATVTDAKGCTKTISRDIEQPEAPLTAEANVENVNCFGEATGAIELDVEGGTAGYSYQWSGGGGNSQSAYDLPAGEYFVTVTDANNCTLTLSEIILEPAAALAVAATTAPATCGNPNGSISLNVEGGTAPYRYNWGGGITTKNRTGLAAGVYTVTVSDFFDCTQILTNVINSQGSAIALLANTVNVACFGAATGSINLTINNGVAPFSVNWDNGSTGQNLAGLAANTYSAIVTDANGCTSSVSQTVSQPASAVAASAVASDVACFGDATGSISLEVSGGTGSFNFNWNNGATTQNLAGLAANTYSATVTDANGCTSSISQIISQPNAALAASAVAGNVDCFGDASGSISLGVSGGTPNYSFVWSNGSTAQNQTGLAANTYSATVTDANGCSTTLERSITQPAAALAASATATDVSCFGSADGTASIAASGGTGAFSFVWTNGATAQNLNGLAAGTYLATVSDAENCTATVEVNVAQPTALLLTATATAQTANNLNDGTATANPTGGTAPYTFLWSNGSTDASIAGLAPGAYSVVVTDAKGCSTAQTATVNSFNCALLANISGTNVSCFGANDGTATANLQGATQPIEYQWSNGASTASIQNLAAGNYLLQILDANGCPATANVIISEPNLLQVNASATAPTANNLNDGTATANPNGGTGNYLFEWSNGEKTQTISNLAPGTYSVIVSDENGCSAVQSVVVATFGCALLADFTVKNVSCAGAADGQVAVNPTGGSEPYTFVWSNGQTTATATGLSGGSYAVVVADALGCETIVTASIAEPTALNATIFNQTNVICPDDATGTATLAFTGGTAPHGILWSNGASGNLASGLAPGVYSAVVTDGNGCTATTQATIVAIDDIAPQLTCPANILRCSDDNKVDYPAPSAADNCSSAGGNWNIIAGLPSGSTFPIGTTTQTYTFTDASGNVGSCSFEVKILTPVEIAAPVVTNDTDSKNIGSIQITVQGGLPPYLFNWTKDGSPFATIEDLANLGAGNYAVIVTDANGCEVSQQNIVVGNLVGTAEPVWVGSLRILPNPSAGQFRLIFEEVLREKLEISVFDATGRLVHQSTFSESQKLDLHLDHLPEGIYALRLHSAGEAGTRVLVIQR